jgi:membrane protein required for colicin V production
MTLYDAAMAAVVVLGMVWGAWRGLTWQVASLASLVLGYSVASSASAGLAAHFPGEPIVARALAMLALYVLTSGGIFGLAWMIRATLRRLRFEAYDRHLGMVLGGLEGALLGVIATLFVVSLAPQSRGPIFASPSGRVVGGLMAAVGPALPGEVRDVLAPFWSGGPAPGPGPGPAAVPVAEADPAAAFEAEVDRLRRSAGRALGEAISSGDPAPVRGLIDEGRDALGRTVDDQLQRMSQRHGQPPAAPRR